MGIVGVGEISGWRWGELLTEWAMLAGDRMRRLWTECPYTGRAEQHNL